MADVRHLSDLVDCARRLNNVHRCGDGRAETTRQERIAAGRSAPKRNLAMAMTLPRIIVFVVLTHTAFGAARVTSSLYALSNKASPFTVGVVIALFALVPALLAVRAGRWLAT